MPMLRLFSIALLIGWMGLIFFFSSQQWSGDNTGSLLQSFLARFLPDFLQNLSSETLNALNYTFRKSAHFTEFAILMAISYFAFRVGFLRPPTTALYSGLALSMAYGIFDETYQTFVPGRTGSPFDALIDAAGALLTFWIIRRRVVRPVASL